MNERIKELMWNAGLNSNYVEGFDSIYSEQLEKFAELIVRECCDKFVDMQYKYPAIIAAYEVKKYFGVVE